MKKRILFFATLLFALFFLPAVSGAQTIAQTVQSGDTAQLAQLISSGANVNQADSTGTTPLMLAVNYGDIIMSNQLVAAGAGVNLKDNKGNTALIIAAKDGYIDIVSLLLANGADPSLHGGSMRAMDYAVETKASDLANETPRNTRIDLDATFQTLLAAQRH